MLSSFVSPLFHSTDTPLVLTSPYVIVSPAAIPDMLPPLPVRICPPPGHGRRRTTRDGRHFVTATLGPGSMFGEASLLGGQGPDTRAVGLESGTVWVMPAKQAIEISSTEAMFGFGLMQAIGQRVVEAENRLEQMAYSTIASRLAALLLELAEDDPNGIVRVTHQELASMLGTWRETISKTLQDFRRRGLVASGRRQLRLLDKEGLQLEAGDIF